MLAAAEPRNMCGHHYKRRRVRINRSPGEATTSADDVRAPPPPTRVCVDCKTSKTPLWRGGPAGPQSIWALSPHDLDNFDRDSSPNTSKAFEQTV
ncbi:GATA transcription factor 17 [Acorus gramineus]|uniref:GATA transcription factor 17 n=1 Tax=Acorus gramineus TaxID=55184 RepID=A0AAV9BWG9_ACOGR|nr:GATA transcription factor 17 [Acorus gramineus]